MKDHSQVRPRPLCRLTELNKAFVAGEQQWTCGHTEWNSQTATYVWEIWDLDDAFKELHFSGSVEELREAAGGHNSVTDRSNKRYKNVFLPSSSDNLPRKEVTEALSMSQKNIWSNAYNPDDMVELRFDLTQLGLIEWKQICTTLTAVEFEHQPDWEVVEEAAVQYEGYQRRQSALSSWSVGFGPIGVQLTQNWWEKTSTSNQREVWCVYPKPDMSYVQSQLQRPAATNKYYSTKRGLIRRWK